LQTPSDGKSAFKVREQPKQQFENNDKPNTTISKDIKGKTMIGESSQQVTKGTKCFKCHGYGHFAYRCPTRSLLLNEVHDDKDHEFKEVVHDPTRDFTDVEEDLKEYGTHLNVITCLHATSREDDWHKSSVFHTYFGHEGKNYKVMIDGGSYVNIISTTAVGKMSLKAEPHHNHTMSLKLIRTSSELPSVVASLFSF